MQSPLQQLPPDYEVPSFGLEAASAPKAGHTSDSEDEDVVKFKGYNQKSIVYDSEDEDLYVDKSCGNGAEESGEGSGAAPETSSSSVFGLQSPPYVRKYENTKRASLELWPFLCDLYCCHVSLLLVH